MKTLNYLTSVILILLSSCTQQLVVEDNEPQNGPALIQDHVKKKSLVSKDDSFYKKLTATMMWQSIPRSILERIDHHTDVFLIEFDHSPIEVITIRLISSLNYEYLVFYKLNDKLLPVIAKSISKGSMIQLSITDLNAQPYFELFVNENNKIGNFNVTKDIPFETIVPKNASSSRTTGTCPEISSSYGNCLLCAVNECESDWVCRVTCAFMFPECFIGFSLACATIWI
ncbi:MAG: hypothetical protein HRU69_06440 [Flammeovirgaceae bacterium]|nr:MAG: hypothetical protein HRU69_06440 [Flammeovirgaceae bacterium]